MIKFFALLLLVFPLASNAATYYVKNAGSDAAAGTSDAAAYKTAAKITSLTLSAGDNVYFLCGDVWNERLTIAENGTSGSRITIGAYYMNGGTETVGCPTDGTNKPEFRGTYSGPCTPAGSCIDTASARPSGIFSGMVTVNGDYVTLQNLYVTNSAGRGIQVGENDYVRLYDVVVDHSVGANLHVNLGDNVHIRDSETSRGSVSHKYGDYQAIGRATYAGSNILVGSTGALVENNYFHENWGEGFIFLKASNKGIFRNNTMAANRRAGPYMDGSAEVVVEHNIIVGDPADEWSDFATPTYSTGIVVRTEDYGVSTFDSTGNVIRNNLITGVKDCLTMGMEPAAESAGRQVGAIFMNNTCVRAQESISILTAAANTGTTEISNNIFIDIVDPDSCSAPTDVDVTLSYNIWDQAQSVSKCNGTGDVTTGVVLNTTTGWANFGPGNLPTETDFEPVSASTAENAGLAQTATILATVDYPLYADITDPCSTFDLTEVGYDYLCNARANPPDIGGIELGGAPTPPSNVTVPFYMNVGTTGELVLSKTYLTEAYCTGWNSSGTTANVIANTTDDAVYQAWRIENGTATCPIPIANGDYDVTFLFMEPYWGVTEGSCDVNNLTRQFHIDIEGNREASNYAICADAGAAETAVRKTFPSITVADETLTIALSNGTGTDPKPVLMGIEITTAAPEAADSLTLGNSTPTVVKDNQYPAVSNLNVTSVCQANTTTTNAIRITAVNTTGLSSGTAAITDDNSDVEYTPASATVVEAPGSLIATISDGNDTDNCTITINQRGGKFIAFTVFDDFGVKLSSTTGWGYCWTTFGNDMTNANITCALDADETTDAAGEMKIYDDAFPEVGVGVRVQYWLLNTDAIAGTDGTKSYRPPYGISKVRR